MSVFSQGSSCVFDQPTFVFDQLDLLSIFFLIAVHYMGRDLKLDMELYHYVRRRIVSGIDCAGLEDLKITVTYLQNFQSIEFLNTHREIC